MLEFLKHGVENSSLNCLKFVKREKKQASVVVRNLEVNDRNGIDLYHFEKSFERCETSIWREEGGLICGYLVTPLLLTDVHPRTQYTNGFLILNFDGSHSSFKGGLI